MKYGNFEIDLIDYKSNIRGGINMELEQVLHLRQTTRKYLPGQIERKDLEKMRWGLVGDFVERFCLRISIFCDMINMLRIRAFCWNDSFGISSGFSCFCNFLQV